MAWIHYSVVWSLVIKPVRTCTLYTWEGKPSKPGNLRNNIKHATKSSLPPEPRLKLTTAIICRLFHALSSATKEKLEI